MENKGLKSSRWAQTSHRQAPSIRSADWACPSCGFMNFSWRKECLRCPPLESGISNDVKVTNIPQQPDTISLLPQTLNKSLPKNEDYTNAGSLKSTYTDPLQDPGLYNGERGLATSRWAPRNHRGRPADPHGGGVWIRVGLKHKH